MGKSKVERDGGGLERLVRRDRVEVCITTYEWG